MVKLNIQSWIFILSFNIMFSFTRAATLKYAAIFVRHGARSPLAALPALDKKLSWPTGFGQLTPLGQRQLYLLGCGFRKDYVHDFKLLNPEYDSNELKVRTTNYKRTTASAAALLHGLYPNTTTKLTEEQLKNANLWTPPFKLDIEEFIKADLKDSAVPYDATIIPIISYNKTMDRMLEFASCPRYESYWDIYFASPKFDDLYKKHQKTLKLVTELFELDLKDYDDESVFYLIDYLLSAEFHGQLPELTKMPEILHELNIFFGEMLIQVLTFDKWMNSIAMHEISQFLPKSFDMVIDNRNKGKKVDLFITHDMTMIQYLIGLNINQDLFKIVPFAANLIFELWENQGNYNVHIKFNGNLVREQTLENFKKDMDAIKKLEGTWEEECRLKDSVDMEC